MAVPQEQPPLDTEKELTEWLTRQIVAINIELNKSKDFEVLYILPDKLYIGMVRYFGDTIDATVTAEGLWCYKSTGWVQII